MRGRWEEGEFLKEGGREESVCDTIICNTFNSKHEIRKDKPQNMPKIYPIRGYNAYSALDGYTCMGHMGAVPMGWVWLTILGVVYILTQCLQSKSSCKVGCGITALWNRTNGNLPLAHEVCIDSQPPPPPSPSSPGNISLPLARYNWLHPLTSSYSDSAAIACCRGGKCGRVLPPTCDL